ncbi:MAG: aldehyde dehydrogenase family protein [Longimicrobiales bacterium]
MSKDTVEIPDLMDSLEYGPAPENTAEVRAWLSDHDAFGHFINGAFTDPTGSDLFDVVNPADDTRIARVVQGSSDDVDAAVSAARSAFADWAALDGHHRARYLYAIARQVQKHARFLAVLETLDNGKPIRESRDIDIPLVARHFYHHAGWAQLVDTDPELRDYRPLGVAGQIIPWNFPFLMLAWKVAPALAAGNTVVLKPAEYTPLTALRFAGICRDVGLPDGVVNIVTGDGETGALIVDHPDVHKIAFTGSTEVGRIIRRATAGTGKKVSLELGGKSPFVVYEDADLDSVVEGVVDAIWFNQGQVCCAGSRILVQEGVADRLVHKLRQRMERLRCGDPLDKSTDIGAIVASVQLERIEGLVEEGREEGAEIWQPTWAVPQEGCFYPPTLITDVSPAATVSQVEIFGPVVVLMTFRTHDESVQLANNTPYGLAASVWTENINLALDVAPRIRAGTVWVNSTNLFDAASGFGGYKESGFGREGGREGLYEYLQPDLSAEPDPEPHPDYQASRSTPDSQPSDEPESAGSSAPPIDRTAKHYIGGKQSRPDGGYSLDVHGPDGTKLGEVGKGNRKDIRNAVEAAHRAEPGWRTTPAHTRAQILYYIAENLTARADEFADRLRDQGAPVDRAAAEVDAAVRRLFTYAAWADKWDGAVHHTPIRNVTLAMPEPIGVFAVACPDPLPLLGFISAVMPAVVMGNTVVALPSTTGPLSATDLYQVLDTSDVPDGVINIVTGPRLELTEVLAAHYDVDAFWYFADDGGGGVVERLSAGNMKRTWVVPARDWWAPARGEGPEFLRRATQPKNIWVPYGA